MSTVGKLPDKDCLTIFESLYHGAPPPPDLPFKIMAVPRHSHHLSPPPLQFKVGIYVLLRPQRELPSPPKAPSHLDHLVETHEEEKPITRWQLSGPQNPKNRSNSSKIVQRYCYPRANDSYGEGLGGTLSTVISNGKEQHEYRILVVYHSAKRQRSGSTGPKTKKAKTTKSSTLVRRRVYWTDKRVPKSQDQSSPPELVQEFDPVVPTFVSPSKLREGNGSADDRSDVLDATPLSSLMPPPPPAWFDHFWSPPNPHPCEYLEDYSSQELDFGFFPLDSPVAIVESDLLKSLTPGRHGGDSGDFADTLEQVKHSLKQRVQASPVDERAEMTAQLRSWTHEMVKLAAESSPPAGPAP